MEADRCEQPQNALVQVNTRPSDLCTAVVASAMCLRGTPLGLVADLHECDVVVGEQPNVILYPSVLRYGRPLLLPLLSPMVTDVPQLITQVLHGGGGGGELVCRSQLQLMHSVCSLRPPCGAVQLS